MISLDQVLLLQEKVEHAVVKINDLTEKNERLASENDALRSKCAELSKALSEKTELVSAYESQQGKIEEGILKALKRLDGVENAILEGKLHPNQGAASSAPSAEVKPVPQKPVQPVKEETSEPVIEESTPDFPEESDITLPVPEKADYPETQVNNNFDIF